MLDAQEEERRRISREIHDDLGGRITEIALSIRRITRETGNVSDTIVSELDQLLGKIQELSTAIRNLSHQLHSPVLEIAGLQAGVQSLCKEFQNKTGIEVLFTSSAGLRDISRDAALCVYRIAQEALNNIRKHSGAKKAVVDLRRSPRQIQLTISDFGRGFNPARSRKRGLGLISMAERARLLQGSVQIQSQLGNGTEVRLELPVARRSAVRILPAERQESA